ncbi:MAG: thioredoxin family protein [Verrucomicrobia bacterium]|nr:thioredoxin family protein [Verrucomicrobiota bacterium]
MALGRFVGSLLGCFLLFSLQEGFGELPLLEDYTKAKEIAETYERPLLLLFTGSDWSSSSQKILEMVMDKADFKETLGNTFVCVKVDFPERNQHSRETLLQNEILREKYQIKEFPLFVILDKEEREVSRLSYLEKEPKAYAEQLKELFFTYTALVNSVEKALCEKEPSAASLEALYEKVSTLGCFYLKDKLLQEGMKCEKSVFFPLEAYARLVKAKEHDLPEAEMLRELIQKRDQNNEKKGRLRLALLDFQAHEENKDEALKFLQSYIETFGEADLQQLFKLHLVISEFFQKAEGLGTGERFQTVSAE